MERDADGGYTSTMGWWTISGESLMEMLREVHSGGDPDLVYAEHYANSQITTYEDGDS